VAATKKSPAVSIGPLRVHLCTRYFSGTLSQLIESTRNDCCSIALLTIADPIEAVTGD